MIRANKKIWKNLSEWNFFCDKFLRLFEWFEEFFGGFLMDFMTNLVNFSRINQPFFAPTKTLCAFIIFHSPDNFKQNFPSISIVTFLFFLLPATKWKFLRLIFNVKFKTKRILKVWKVGSCEILNYHKRNFYHDFFMILKTKGNEEKQ